MAGHPVKTAIVTGSSRGIGRAIAFRLAGEGFHVVLTGRDTDALGEVEAGILASGGSCCSLAADLRGPTAAGSLIDFALSLTGRIDVLVNNAGATKRGGFLQLSDADWLDGYALKLHGAVRMTRAAWPYLEEVRGSIINIGGVGGRTPGAEFSIGGSVNAALMAFTKSIADTAIPSGIQVNLINPGAVRTERLAKRLTSMTEEEFIDQEKVTRIGEPEDIAAFVAYLLSPAGRFLHGSLIDIDGGATKSL